MNSWNIAVAKSSLSELIMDSKKEPQMITNRNRPVAVVMDIHEYEALGLKKVRTPTVGDLLQELHAIQNEEKAVIEIPARKDRRNMV
ncbi:MAG: type II toxin-antitoxin system Phd/YefM family antitoxin [Victivallales bacterium]|jgi:prevent-host-death family protein